MQAPFYTREELERYNFKQDALYKFRTPQGNITGYFSNVSDTVFREGIWSKEYTFHDGQVLGSKTDHKYTEKQNYFDTHVFSGEYNVFHVNNDCVAERLKDENYKKGEKIDMIEEGRECYGVIETKGESTPPLTIIGQIVLLTRAGGKSRRKRTTNRTRRTRRKRRTSRK